MEKDEIPTQNNAKNARPDSGQGRECNASSTAPLGMAVGKSTLDKLV